ncbi:hypothetical protein BJ742DRAFT_824429 [Cladochytrium replicatum]|nr:hypothetical protein BJ742DRAFT_824429 [Cladochytrium replicatum]
MAAAATTSWSNTYNPLTYNYWASRVITVSTVPAAYSFSYSVAVAQGTPSLYVLDPVVYSSWSAGTTFVPQTYRYGARIDPPTGGRDSFSLVFTSATTYPVILYCGPYSTTISSVVTIFSQNCSGVTIAANWVDLNIGPPAQTTTIPPLTLTSSPSPTGDTGGGGVSTGAVVGIIVGAVVVAGALSAAIVITMLRRRNRKATMELTQQQRQSTYIGPGLPPPPPGPPSATGGYFYPMPGTDAASSSDSGLGNSAGTAGYVSAQTPQFQPGSPGLPYAVPPPQFQQQQQHPPPQPQGYASPGIPYAQMPPPPGSNGGYAPLPNTGVAAPTFQQQPVVTQIAGNNAYQN